MDDVEDVLVEVFGDVFDVGEECCFVGGVNLVEDGLVGVGEGADDVEDLFDFGDYFTFGHLFMGLKKMVGG